MIRRNRHNGRFSLLPSHAPFTFLSLYHQPTNQILQDLKLDRFHLGPEPGDFALDLGIGLANLDFERARLVADAALLEIEVEPHSGLRSCNLLAQFLPQFFNLGLQPFMLRLHHREVVLSKQLDLGFQLGKVHFVGIDRLRREGKVKVEKIGGVVRVVT